MDLKDETVNSKLPDMFLAFSFKCNNTWMYSYRLDNGSGSSQGDGERLTDIICRLQWRIQRGFREVV